MSIRDLEVYTKNLWDWAFLDECFQGTRIRVPDLDGCVERNGHFLIIEAKSPGVSVPTGQSIMFDRFVRLAPGKTSVLVLWGMPSDPIQMRMWGEDTHPVDCTKADVQRLVSQWFKGANESR
jgi:hypothetical protein